MRTNTDAAAGTRVQILTQLLVHTAAVASTVRKRAAKKEAEATCLQMLRMHRYRARSGRGYQGVGFCQQRHGKRARMFYKDQVG
jgi:hypothetical protein